jgi:hypothetical protein
MANEIAPRLKRRSPPLKRASVETIDREISRAYERAREGGEKPPNINEVVAPVRAALAALGYFATNRQIQKAASGEKHVGQRLTAGRPAR